MDKYLLGIDYGGTVTKAAVFGSDGRQVSVYSEKTDVAFSADGRCEIDPVRLKKTVMSVIRGAVAESGIAPSDVACVGISGHGKRLYVTDKSGEPVFCGILSSDRRGGEISERWKRDGTSDRAKKLTLQDADAPLPPVLLRWLKENEPDAYKRIGRVFEAKDYIRFLLTGEAYAEVTDYSGAGLMDLVNQRFDPKITDIFGISEIYGAIPPAVHSADLCGFITAEAAQLCGLEKGTPVSGGMFDIDACAVALSAAVPGDICVITGTWSINEYISASPVIADDGTRNSLFALPGRYLIEQSSPTSAGNLDFFIGTVFGGMPYEEADMLVKECPYNGVIFTPYLYGTNSKAKTAALSGLTRAHTRADILRAVFEGVAFSHKLHFDALCAHRDAPETVLMGGGVCSSAVWTQMFADVLGVRLRTSSAKELGALGAAVCAAVCAGIYPDLQTAEKSMTGDGAVYEPDPAANAVYREKYGKFLEEANG
jgi:L-xylulokinase